MKPPADLAITRAIIGLGHAIGLTVIAEGVETEEVSLALKDAHCDQLQGYHFAKPLTAEGLAKWINRSSPAAPANSYLKLVPCERGLAS